MIGLVKGLVFGVVAAAIAGAVVGVVSGYIGIISSIGAIAAGFVGGVGMGAGFGGKEPENNVAAYGIPVVVAAVAFLAMYGVVFAQIIANAAGEEGYEVGAASVFLTMAFRPSLFTNLLAKTFDFKDAVIFIFSIFAVFYGGATQVARAAQMQAPVDERALPEWTRKKKEESK